MIKNSNNLHQNLSQKKISTRDSKRVGGIQAVILAGGEGKRIYPLGVHKPKSMFEIMGKPLIQHVVENLKKVGVSDLIVVTGHKQEQIHNFLADGKSLGVKIRYTSQKNPLGQADALMTVKPFIKNNFFVVNANDIFHHELLGQMITKADECGSSLVLAGRKVADPWRFGVMDFNKGVLSRVVEKPARGTQPSNFAVMGVYYFSPLIFELIETTPVLESDDQLERAYQKFIDQNLACHVEYDNYFESYKYPWNLLEISDLLLQHSFDKSFISDSAQISKQAIITGKVIIEDNVKVFENAVIRGPVYIGADSVIGNGACIWGGCSLGKKCIVGAGSEIKHVVFGDMVWTHRSYVGDSIVANNCSFASGSVVANWRFDDQNIFVNIKGDKVDTGLNKFGAIIAEGCRTGANSSILPGLKLGPNSIVGPGVTLSQDLATGQTALLQPSSYRVVDNKLNLVEKNFDQHLKKVRSS